MFVRSKINHESTYHSVFELDDDSNGLPALKELFPNAKAVNYLNFILFSTSGLSGHYCTIEDAEKLIKDKEKGIIEEDEDYDNITVTFLIIHPRIVCLKSGNVRIETLEDIDYLKELRQASWDAVQQIGRG